MKVIQRLQGAQYQPSKFLIARRVFSSGSLLAVVDLDGVIASELSAISGTPGMLKLIPHAVLRYVGIKRDIEARLLQEPVAPDSARGERPIPKAPRQAFWDWESQCRYPASMEQLFHVVRQVRLEEVAMLRAEMYGKAIRQWQEDVAFPDGDATVVHLDPRDEAAMSVFFTACSGHVRTGTPDFRPCMRSAAGLLGLFQGRVIDTRQRGIDVATFLIDEARARFDRQ